MNSSNTKLLSYQHPAIHFSPNKGWSNDPNGCIYFKGKWHLFFQHYPDGIIWGPMHWGHAISDDLLHWEEQPIALYPDEHGLIFSGSAIYDKNNTSGLFDEEGGLVLFFTHAKKISKDFYEESQSIAFSHDGVNFYKYEGNPVIPNPGEEDIRDPRVFEFDDSYFMVLAVGNCVWFYQSYNLLDWKKCGEFGKEHGTHEGVWECPDIMFFELDGKTICVLKVSVQAGHPFGGSGEQIFYGGFSGETFVPFQEDFSWLDLGPDIYASQLFTETPDSNPIVIGWMNNISYMNDIPADDFRGSMTIPRKLSLVANEFTYKLYQQPILQRLNKDVFLYENDIVINVFHKYKACLSPSLKNRSVFDIMLNGILCSGHLILTLSSEEKDICSIEWNSDEKCLIIYRNSESLNTFGKKIYSSSSFILKSGLHKVHCLIDTQSVEFFFNDGEYSATLLLFRETQVDMFTAKSTKGASFSEIVISKLKA